MSDLTCYNYKGWGEKAQGSHYYSQAVRVGDTIQCSGQGMYPRAQVACIVADDLLGGWANEGKFEFYKEINAQIDQAFENVQSALTAADGKGWDQVSIRRV